MFVIYWLIVKPIWTYYEWNDDSKIMGQKFRWNWKLNQKQLIEPTFC